MGGALTRILGRAAAAGGGGPTSTQWRLYFPAGTTTQNPITSDGVEIGNVEMRATIGGADQCGSGTASASSQYSSSFSPDRAFAGGAAGDWSSSFAGNYQSWLQYTFASAVAVNEIAVRKDSGTGPSCIQLQYYDGAQWVTTIEAPGPLTWSNGETKTFSTPPLDTGYTRWRINCVTGAAGGNDMYFVFVEMRESAGGASHCFGGTASASSQYSGAYQASNAFQTSNAWVPSNLNGTGEWLEYQFWRKEQIAQFTIKCNGANSGPQQVKLQYYDGSTWVDAYTSASGLSWSAAETKTFTV